MDLNNLNKRQRRAIRGRAFRSDNFSDLRRAKIILA